MWTQLQWCTGSAEALPLVCWHSYSGMLWVQKHYHLYVETVTDSAMLCVQRNYHLYVDTVTVPLLWVQNHYHLYIDTVTVPCCEFRSVTTCDSTWLELEVPLLYQDVWSRSLHTQALYTLRTTSTKWLLLAECTALLSRARPLRTWTRHSGRRQKLLLRSGDICIWNVILTLLHYYPCVNVMG